MKATNIIIVVLIIVSVALAGVLIANNSTVNESKTDVANYKEKVSQLEASNNNLTAEKENLIQTIKEYEQKEKRYLEVQAQLKEIAGIAPAKKAIAKKNTDLDPASNTQQDLNTLEVNQGELKKLRKERRKLYSQINSLKKKDANSRVEKEKIEKQIAKLQAEMDKTDILIDALDKKVKDAEAIAAAEIAENNTIYYVIDKRSELKKNGLISSEGGVLWGLFGTTDVVRNDYTYKGFQSQNLNDNRDIVINANIDDITIHTKQHRSCYSLEKIDENKTILAIKNPEMFRKDKHLIIEID